jgi:hypothetical protein
MKQLKEESNFRDKFKKKQGSKKIGKSERVHAKNKPFMMMKKKKITELKDSIKRINVKKKKDKRQMGHFRKCTK